MEIKSQQATKIEQTVSNQETFQMQIDLSVVGCFDNSPVVDKAAAFTRERKQIHQEILGFISDKVIPGAILAARPEWEVIPAITKQLITDSKSKTTSSFHIRSSNSGFEYKGSVSIDALLISNRNIYPTESVFGVRGLLGNAISMAVTNALYDHFFENSSSVSKTESGVRVSDKGAELREIREFRDNL